MTKRKSDVEDMIELAAKMPWWINIILAVGSYLILHHYATRPNPPTPTEMNQLGDYTVSVFWPTLADVRTIPYAFYFYPGRHRVFN